MAEETKKTFANASVAPADFDWEAFEGSSEIYGQNDRKEIEEAYDQTLSKIVENEVVEGTVTAISKREVIVNIGYKSEGVIQAPEFRYNPDLKVGDKVEVYVESAEDRKGQLILSHKKARALKSWDRVNEACNNDEIVKGFIKTRTKGGAETFELQGSEGQPQEHDYKRNPAGFRRVPVPLSRSAALSVRSG